MISGYWQLMRKILALKIGALASGTKLTPHQFGVSLEFQWAVNKNILLANHPKLWPSFNMPNLYLEKDFFRKLAHTNNFVAPMV